MIFVRLNNLWFSKPMYDKIKNNINPVSIWFDLFSCFITHFSLLYFSLSLFFKPFPFCIFTLYLFWSFDLFPFNFDSWKSEEIYFMSSLKVGFNPFRIDDTDWSHDTSRASHSKFCKQKTRRNDILLWQCWGWVQSDNSAFWVV